MSVDGWDDEGVNTATSAVTSSMSGMKIDNSSFFGRKNDSGNRDSFRGGRGGGGGFRGGDSEKGEWRNREEGGGFRSDRNDGDSGGFRGRGAEGGGFRRGDDGEGGGFRSGRGDGEGGGFQRRDDGEGGGFRSGRGDGEGGGFRRRDDGEGGGFKGGRGYGEGGGFRRRDDGGGDGNEGNPEEPKERYVPPELLEGEAAFEERTAMYQGCGINFTQLREINVEVTGGGGKQPGRTLTFEELGLRQLMLTNVTKCGYKDPTPIQQHASPCLLKGFDVMACAQTGSGKTAAFLLPIIHCLLDDENLSPSFTVPVTPEALIVVPTRELAVQINKEANMYTFSCLVKTRVVCGGTTFFSQKNSLQGGCNILVATPGRLLQFVNDDIVSFDKVKFFILDEADKLLDMGFMPEVQKIVSKLPEKTSRVNAMFTVTFSESIQLAALDFLRKNYVFITVGVLGAACQDITQRILEVERSKKRNKLLDLLKETKDDDKVLIFCATKRGVDFIALSVAYEGHSSTSIHGDRRQSQRELALGEFIRGQRKVLVASSVASSGLDFPNVSMVINYDLPARIEEYIHRIGRTGRAGNTGVAISLYDYNQDACISRALASALRKAKQEVPEFLGGDPGKRGCIKL